MAEMKVKAAFLREGDRFTAYTLGPNPMPDGEWEVALDTPRHGQTLFTDPTSGLIMEVPVLFFKCRAIPDPSGRPPSTNRLGGWRAFLPEHEVLINRDAGLTPDPGQPARLESTPGS